MFTIFIADEASTDAALAYASFESEAAMLDGLDCLVQAMEGTRVAACPAVQALAVIDADGKLVSADYYELPGSAQRSMVAVLEIA
jgi:hypothetical protein